jgi:hypothetical protein
VSQVWSLNLISSFQTGSASGVRACMATVHLKLSPAVALAR